MKSVLILSKKEKIKSFSRSTRRMRPTCDSDGVMDIIACRGRTRSLPHLGGGRLSEEDIAQAMAKRPNRLRY
jgi:hypothetical protein